MNLVHNVSASIRYGVDRSKHCHHVMTLSPNDTVTEWSSCDRVVIL